MSKKTKRASNALHFLFIASISSLGYSIPLHCAAEEPPKAAPFVFNASDMLLWWAFKYAAEYIETHRLEVAEITFITNNSHWNCVGTLGPHVEEAKKLQTLCHCKINLIGRDLPDRDNVVFMTRLAVAIGGTFVREESELSTAPRPPIPGINLHAIQSKAIAARLPKLPAPLRPVDPGPLAGVYSANPPIKPPQQPSSSAEGHGHEGTLDDEAPIIDPNSVPRELSFEKANSPAPTPVRALSSTTLGGATFIP